MFTPARTAGSRRGFRLDRVEMLNWGTFHKQVWGLNADGNNTLVTGDIGSGKSTLVDAITALLVPRVSFNKAAGASPGERSLESYFFGRYKAERGEPGLASKPVSLRDANSYSVLLARFHNEALGQTVTLAQLFWAKTQQGPPARLYLIADSALSIREHFANFGSNIDRLKKRLRSIKTAETFESFPPYAAAYRRRFGIENERAMELFHQAISMKSIGNLTDFVRGHMLEAFPVQDRIDALVAHYQDLDRAHELVQTAKFQLGFLQPLVEDCDRREVLAAEAEKLRACREALRPWFASKKKGLLEKRVADLDAQMEKLAHRISGAEETRSRRRGERDAIRQAIAEQGGDRIERITAEIAETLARKEDRSQRAEKYEARVRALGFPVPADADAFLGNRRAIELAAAETEAAEAQAQNLLSESNLELRQLQEQYEEIAAELESLRRRRSNIPRHMLEMRAELCRAAGLRETELPFAGELLEVRREEREWEGAIERLARGFGLSLLAPNSHYASVAEWVDRTHLNGRLVYFRVLRPRPVDHSSLPPASLAHKLTIKPESVFYEWLDAEVALRFNFACCDTLEQFRREPQAVTRAGQIKGKGERHEKDDRRAVDDRSHYVLGWSNERKIEALEITKKQLENRRATLMAKMGVLERQRMEARGRKTKLAELGMFESFRELDWRPLASEVERLEAERRALEEGSDILRTLRAQLALIDTALGEIEAKLLSDQKERAKLEDRRAAAVKLMQDCEELLARTGEAQTAAFASLESINQEAAGDRNQEAAGDRAWTVENCDNRERDLREWLQAKIDAEVKKSSALEVKIVKAMQSYRARFPLETQEVDASVDAADEYRAMLRRLQEDDLPRFEQQFKSLLNENTIREVANFQSQLNRERETIRERIETINLSLRGIDYNPGRYILLEATPNSDQEVRDFRDALRSCTEGSLGGAGGGEYAEEKFVQVKRIIERFRGREGAAEIDSRWTAKVTDVRQWFAFSASERYREDDREFEHYTDSGGKSGGQKEKLAYTVLAASLAYQFGLEEGATRPRSFRFVVIDEAFGRGSDESARYGLKLFASLDLQLLIVTPLQKIHIIEPFVSSVGFVHNQDGRLSMLRNLTIEEYRAEMARRTLREVETAQAALTE
jgi:uncharacterized protein YPO0396